MDKPRTQNPSLDLHVHTTASDGVDAPAEVVKKAKDAGITLLAITDHDAVSGVFEAMEAAEKLGVALLSGVEFSAAFAGELHILGYGVDIQNAALQTMLQGVVDDRERRNRAILDKLAQLGLPVDAAAVGTADQAHSIGRVHIARSMVQAGYATGVDEAFKRYLKRGKPAYVPRKLPKAAQIFDVVRRAGGVAVLAHPANTRLPDQALWPLLEEYAAAGLWGVEAYHPSCDAAHSEIYCRMAKRLGLYCTAGSDYHGDNPGSRHGAALIPREIKRYPALQPAYFELSAMARGTRAEEG